MSGTLTSWVLTLAGAYLVAGLGFAVPFVFRGVDRVDPRASGATWGFRLVILPGVVLLWPLVARRWLAGGPPAERNAHLDAAAGRSQRARPA